MGVQTDAQTTSDPVCASSGCWHSDWFKNSQDKIEQYPNPEADGLDEETKITLANEKAASASLNVDWDPWAGASNKPFVNKDRVTNSVSEVMDIINKE